AATEEPKMSMSAAGPHRSFSCECAACGSASRRHFLAGAVALGAASVWSGDRLFAQTAKPKLIDTHHHFFPPAYQRAWLDWEDRHRIPHFASQVAWSREKAVEGMDQNGITTSVLSIASTPGVWFDSGPEAAARMVRLCNDFAADMMRDYPGR